MNYGMSRTSRRSPTDCEAPSLRIKAPMCAGLVALSAAAAAAAAPAAAPASADTRGVVMGCDGHSLLTGPRELSEVAPADCANSALGGSLAGISGARWRNWGAARATGTGDAVDGLGFLHPARYIVFRLRSSGGLTYYTRMLVVSKGILDDGVTRRGVNKVVNVTPYGMPGNGG